MSRSEFFRIQWSVVLGVAVCAGNFELVARADDAIQALQQGVADLRRDVGNLRTDVAVSRTDIDALRKDADRQQVTTDKLRHDVDALTKCNSDLLFITQGLKAEVDKLRSTLHGSAGAAQCTTCPSSISAACGKCPHCGSTVSQNSGPVKKHQNIWIEGFSLYCSNGKYFLRLEGMKTIGAEIEIASCGACSSCSQPPQFQLLGRAHNNGCCAVTEKERFSKTWEVACPSGCQSVCLKQQSEDLTIPISKPAGCCSQNSPCGQCAACRKSANASRTCQTVASR